MEDSIRIMHWGATGGVSFQIANITKGKFEPKVLIRMGNDPMNIRFLYPDLWIEKHSRVRKYIFQTLREIRKFKPDIVHVHSNFLFMKIIIRAKKLLRYKKIITHHHGTKLRNRKSVPKFIEKNSDRILVSTPDLCFKPEYLYLTNPVDTNLFKNSFNKEKEVLFLRTNPIDYLEQVRILMKRNQEYILTLLDKFHFHEHTKDHMKKYQERFRQTVPYNKMPELLKTPKYYLDYKGYLVLSKLAFEALASGCIVINEKGDYIKPSQFDFEKINNNWLEFYQDIENFQDPYIDKYHSNLIMNNQTREYYPTIEMSVNL